MMHCRVGAKSTVDCIAKILLLPLKFLDEFNKIRSKCTSSVTKPSMGKENASEDGNCILLTLSMFLISFNSLSIFLCLVVNVLCVYALQG